MIGRQLDQAAACLQDPSYLSPIGLSATLTLPINLSHRRGSPHKLDLKGTLGLIIILPVASHTTAKNGAVMLCLFPVPFGSACANQQSACAACGPDVGWGKQ